MTLIIYSVLQMLEKYNGDFLETAAFGSCGVKHEWESHCANDYWVYLEPDKMCHGGLNVLGG